MKPCGRIQLLQGSMKHRSKGWIDWLAIETLNEQNTTRKRRFDDSAAKSQ